MDHHLTRLPDGRYTCALCQWTWRQEPRSPCVGVPRFDYGSWPQGLYTATQLRRVRLSPGNEPDGYYPLVKSPYRRSLYDITKATPRRFSSSRGATTLVMMALLSVFLGVSGENRMKKRDDPGFVQFKEWIIYALFVLTCPVFVLALYVVCGKSPDFMLPCC